MSRWQNYTPYKFSSQILSFVGITVLLGAMLVGGAFTYDSIERTRIQNDNEIHFLAQNIAAMAGMPIITKNIDFLDDILQLNAQFNFVDSILVVDDKNHVLSQVDKVNGVISTKAPLGDVVPGEYDVSTDLAGQKGAIASLIDRLVPAQTTLELWHPIKAGKLLGSIRIQYSLKEFRVQIIQQWKRTFLYAGATVGFIFFLLWLLLRTPMQALHNTASFARNLNENVGKQIQVYAPTKEFFELTESLNILSRKLESQQHALAKSAAHNQSILDNVADGIISLNPEGRILSFNLFSTTLFGFHQDEVLNSPINSLIADISTPIVVGAKECEGRRKDGSVFPIDLAITRSTDQQEIIYFCIVRDITERRHLDRLKSEFVSTVSHELRTPLTSIHGALKLAASGVLGALPEQVSKLLEVGIKNSQRLIFLINDLLDMEKLSAGKMNLQIAPVSLIDIIKQSLQDNAAYGATLNVNYVFAAYPEQVTVLGDSQRLAQILANLLSNAAKFSGTSRQVEVRVQHNSALTHARVEVQDHGEGIPPDFQDQIFSAFSQANNGNTRKQGGTGLGLKISKALVLAMQGEIGFETTIGSGTTFWFSLPLADDTNTQTFAQTD